MSAQIVSTCIVFVLLVGSAGIGVYIRPRLPEDHRTRETTELMQVTITLLATFTALVLGLLTASVKQNYDQDYRDRRAYALELGLLDTCLRDYGPQANTARQTLRAYTAAAIASIWPDEPLPKGVAFPQTSDLPRSEAQPVLAGLINQVGVEIARLGAPDQFHGRLLDLCTTRYSNLQRFRMGLLEDYQRGLFSPFYQILVFWLMVIFACFGLVSPPHGVSGVTIFLCALSLSTVVFVILDLGDPYTGLFHIPSSSMREALAMMTAP